MNNQESKSFNNQWSNYNKPIWLNGVVMVTVIAVVSAIVHVWMNHG